MKGLERGALAKIDRKILAGLGHDETWHMARIPISAAAWSSWKRYCDAIGVSMGRAIAALIAHELVSAIGDHDDGPVFVGELDNGVEERSRLSQIKERSLDTYERDLTSMWRLDQLRLSRQPPPLAKIGRNEPCACGSGLKFKRHGQ